MSVSRSKLLPMAVLMIGIAALASFAIAIPMDDSDAAAATEWYSYGHHIVLNDRSYNPSTYRSIEWIYSDSPLTETNTGTSIAGDPYNRYSATLDLDPSEYPYDQVKPLFVREVATMNDGEVKSFELSINVNPISKVCYFRFMYDDTHTYMYEEITSKTRVAVGVNPIVQVPDDPYMPGYRFDGWFNDKACTSVFDPMKPVTFTDTNQICVYPKWTSDGSVAPGESVRFVTIQPVDGLHIDCGGMTVSHGSSFSFTVSVSDGFRFDLSGLKAVTSLGKELPRTAGSDEAYAFTLDSVSEDTTVFLTGYVQYVKVTNSFDNVTTVGAQEWILKGASLYLPLKSTDGGEVSAKVFMNGVEITGTAFVDGIVRIDDVTGDVTIVAESVPASEPGNDGSDELPWVMIAVAALAVIAVLAVLIVRMRTRRP